MINSKDYNHISRKINFSKNIVLIDKIKSNTSTSTPSLIDYVWGYIGESYTFQTDHTQDMIMFAFKNSRNNIW